PAPYRQDRCRAPARIAAALTEGERVRPRLRHRHRTRHHHSGGPVPVVASQVDRHRHRPHGAGGGECRRTRPPRPWPALGIGCGRYWPLMTDLAKLCRWPMRCRTTKLSTRCKPATHTTGWRQCGHRPPTKDHLTDSWSGLLSGHWYLVTCTVP